MTSHQKINWKSCQSNMKLILLTPNPVLTKSTQPVIDFGKNLKNILSEMKEALLSAKDPKGVGLAAPQIGYPLQIFAIKPRESSSVSFYINPKVLEQSFESIDLPTQNTPLEGCLSIPNTWGVVKRKKALTISYQNQHAKKLIKTFTGFAAIIIQHELDHLNGFLFTKRVLEQQGKLFEIIKSSDGKESLKELPL